jgi:hypothetical protein
LIGLLPIDFRVCFPFDFWGLFCLPSKSIGLSFLWDFWGVTVTVTDFLIGTVTVTVTVTEDFLIGEFCHVIYSRT